MELELELELEKSSLQEPEINTEYLENLKTKIEIMEKYHQVEILKILTTNKCKINENKSGVYINLSFLPKTTIQELVNYIHYIKDQEDIIKIMEYQKREFENSFFIDKEDKENAIISYNT